MIKLVLNENEIFKNIKTNDLQFLKIESLLKSYGCNYDFCKFYLICHDNCYSIMAVLDNSCIVYNNFKQNLDEIIEFICFDKNIISVSFLFDEDILTNKNILADFDLKQGNILKNKNLETGFVFQNQFSNSFDLTSCYDILSLCFNEFDKKVFPSWFCDISHRVRHNQSEVYGVCDIATGILLYKNQHSGIVSQVCVNPKYRKMGYGTEILNYILNKHKDKNFYVYSKDEKTDDFYYKLNFINFGKWLELKRKRIV